MSKTGWLNSLKDVLHCQLQLLTKGENEWSTMIEHAKIKTNEMEIEHNPTVGMRVEDDQSVWYLIGSMEEDNNTLVIDSKELNDKEKELLSWTIEHSILTRSVDVEKYMTESEKFAIQIGDWINKQLMSEHPAFSLPDQLTGGTRLYHEMIPFLLVTDQASSKKASYTDLEKLLRSFLSEDILLIPLNKQEWLIWGPVSLLKDEDLDMFELTEEESVEDSLASITSGLHEMLTSEWIGECHLAVSYPTSPSQCLIETTLTLREATLLGKKFHVGTNIHLPWLMQLERLLNAIPEPQRQKYLEQSLKRMDSFVEVEMIATLETFFSLDCNVSETAKKLYVHRNTLLYRLDKLKQETGLDVRSFRDAVLMNIILLLYKVTKRN